RFVEKLGMDVFTADDLATLGTEPVDYITLNKLAIDYADAIVQVADEVDPELVEYAKATGKPFLAPASEPDKNHYKAFYDSLIDEDEE
ncbi:MAG: glycogen synthase, partial [Duncaniella sp.]|nr:glycogen synthase [Duncaniella sp.]